MSLKKIAKDFTNNKRILIVFNNITHKQMYGTKSEEGENMMSK